MNASNAKYRCWGEKTGSLIPGLPSWTPYNYLDAQTVASGKRETTHIARKCHFKRRWHLEERVPAEGKMCEHWRCVASKHTDEKDWQNYRRMK